MSETSGTKIIREWLESDHGDEDIDDAGGVIRDWFGYAETARLDLERRIDTEVDRLRTAHRRALDEVVRHFPENDLFRKRMAAIIEPVIEP